MTTPAWLKTRNGRIAAGGGAVIALVVVMVALASGSDEGREAATTTSRAVATSTSTAGSSDGTDTAPPSSPSTTEPTAPATVTTPAPTTTGGPPQTTIPPAPSSMVTVPDGTVEVLDPIPTDEPGDFGTGLVVEITELTSVEGEATGPGEIAGPSIRAVLSAINNSAEAIDLNTMQVEITYGPEHSSGIELQAPDVAHFSGSLAPGASATGAYVFNVPPDQRDVIQVIVRYSVDAPVVVFEGTGPAA